MGDHLVDNFIFRNVHDFSPNSAGAGGVLTSAVCFLPPCLSSDAPRLMAGCHGAAAGLPLSGVPTIFAVKTCTIVSLHSLDYIGAAEIAEPRLHSLDCIA
eukprot:11374940-Karenia_brevis.AAC.1